MKKGSIILIGGSLILLLTQCAVKKNTGTRHNKLSSADKIAAAKAAYTPAQMEQGHILYNQKCGECHELKKTIDFTVKEWEHILPDMSRKSKLNREDAATLRAWVITNAKAELQ